MEAYGQILLIAMPAFFVLVLFEKLWGIWKGNDTVPLSDMISSLSSGMTNVTKDVLGLSLIVISYEWMVTKFELVQFEATWVTYVIAFIALDFAGIGLTGFHTNTIYFGTTTSFTTVVRSLIWPVPCDKASLQ
jgi:alkylglycerol monooxygenase